VVVHHLHSRILTISVLVRGKPWMTQQRCAINHRSHVRVSHGLADNPGSLALASKEHAVVAAAALALLQRQLRACRGGWDAAPTIPGRLVGEMRQRYSARISSIRRGRKRRANLQAIGAGTPEPDIALGKVN